MKQWFMFYQTKPESAWIPMVASQRNEVIANLKPPFVTVLDVDHDFDDLGEAPVPLDVRLKCRYKGNLYFDFDSKDIQDAIDDARNFCKELADKDVNPDCLHIFATGGRGFHVEVPLQCVVDRVPAEGIQRQPIINKELAFKLHYDSLDLNVYSTGHGRMWRTPNVQRPNGRYKVPITYQELRDMTVEFYEQITAHPRMPVERVKPSLAATLATMWSKASLAVAKTAVKPNKVDHKILEGLDGKWSPSMEKVLTGDLIEPGVGFHKAALQLAITAHALKKTADQFLTDSEGLCRNYTGSDSSRYGSYDKRRRELLRMYYYIAEHPGYAFSVGGLRSIMKKGVQTPDLTAIATIEVGEGESIADIEPYNGLYSIKSGIYALNKDGEVVQKSRMGIVDPVLLLRHKDGQVFFDGFRVKVYNDGEYHGEVNLWNKAFQSRAAFVNGFSAQHAYAHDLTDLQVTYLQAYLKATNMKTKRVKIQVPKIGFNDVLIPKSPHNEEIRDLVWMGQGECEARSAIGIPKGEEPIEYEGVNPFGSTGSLVETDLLNAARWDQCDYNVTRTDIIDLLNIRSPDVIAPILGWMAAAHGAPIVRRETDNNQFPILYFAAESGAGKSALGSLVLACFYHRKKLPTAAAQTTGFSLDHLLCSTGSVAVFLDEMKFREMDQRTRNKIQNLLRLSYNASALTKGQVDQIRGGLTLQAEILSSPVMVAAEQGETQTALLDRSLMINLNRPSDKYSARFDAMRERGTYRESFGSLGKALMGRYMRISPEEIRGLLKSKRDELYTMFGASLTGAHPRPTVNITIARLGLEILAQVLSIKFGDDAEIQSALKTLDSALIRRAAAVAGRTESTPDEDGPVVALRAPHGELSQVLDTMAFLSTLPDNEPFKITENVEYCIIGDTIDIRPQAMFMHYQRYCASVRETPLYDNFQQFNQALNRYRGRLPIINPGDSPLMLNPATRGLIYRLQRSYLENDHVQSFSCKDA